VSLANIIIGMYMVLLVLGTAATIASIGRPREPITPGGAFAQLIISLGIFIALLVVWPKLLA
jgi:hypothetical protein